MPGVSRQKCVEELFGTNYKKCVSRRFYREKTWQDCADGLPQVHAYDIVYRHALDVSADAQYLAMGSTSGSLWVSEEEGDSWATISTHLPPVYCLRMVA